MGYIRFELTHPGGGLQIGVDRVYIDNVRLLGVGLPLQAESGSGLTNDASTQITQMEISSLIGAAQSQWQGLIQAPNGIAGVSLGQVGVTTPDLSFQNVADIDMESSEQNRNAGSRESGFNNQLFSTNTNVLIGPASLDQQPASDESGLNSDASFASDRHTVNAEPDARLGEGESASVLASVVNENIAMKTNVDKHGSTIGDRPIGVSNFDVSPDLPAPGGEGTIANRNVFNAKKLSLISLQPLPGLACQQNGIVGPPPLFNATAGLGQSEDQQNQSTLQHSLSFGTLTLPPDRDVVNQSASFGTGFVGLTADQLALLNKATITIADLADGYLALTSGTTITLDTDAAGYGWFIDPTPFLSEEFVPSASPWQLQAASGSAAEGKIDLMTVLMHELGHVMGLGHVSSAVDGTRLMAGSIDHGIRRLPSSLDLGSVESSHDNNSELSTQNSALPVWAPYLAHYTTASDATPTTPLTPINPARLVQAAQLPTHSGIFNSNFSITDPANAQYGWDQSGDVSIANGQAVLSENSNVISTLSQLFTLPAGSTHLRFTLVDVNLQTNGANRPSDAFEVALLEASTLTPLAGVTAGLTQTDSLFNIQQDGTVRFSNRVTLSTGTLSGSTLDLTQPVIVDIDLTGITVGAGARLSFDLLGFGDRTSTIVLDNVLLTNGQPTAAPVAVNDSYSVAEGGTFLSTQLSGLLANDTDIDTSQAGLASALVNGPLQGTLTLNADGSFTYVHNGSETLTDSFTYRVSDGINFSNLATVSLTITPTNDAPTIAAIPAQSVEQGRTLTVNVIAIDPDDSNISPESSALTFSLQPNTLTGISLDPATGLLSWAVPRTQTVGRYTIAVTVTDAGTPALSATRSVTVDVLELSNTAPTLDPIGPKTVNEEAELRFTISATDLDLPAQTLTYTATPLPPGPRLTRSPANSRIS